MPRQNTPNPGANYSPAASFDNPLPPSLGSTATIEAAGGYATVAFHLIPPTGATVAFEATFGAEAWVPVTMRSIGADLNVQSHSGAPESFIGSIAGAQAFRARVFVAGTSPGRIAGSLRPQPSIAEGMEFGWPPHQRGVPTQHRRFRATSTGTDLGVWPTPAAGGRIHATDAVGNVWGKSGRLVLHDGDASDDERILLDVSLPDPGFHTVLPIESHFVLPWAATVGAPILADVSGQLKASLVLIGYEA